MLKAFLVGRARSFGYAFKGIGILFRTQVNAQIHLLAALVITVMGFWLKLTPWEWCVIVVCMAMVLLAEALNTAVEFLVDLVSPDYHPLAGKVKDVAAGAVLISVMVCGIAWGIIYIPKLFILLGV